MRNPDRIPVLLDLIRTEWEKYPDMRLMQLLVNILDARPNPLFTVEDDVIIEKIEKLCDEVNR